MRRFEDRRHAGRELAVLLEDHAGREDVVVLALPRGGVPVAYEVATHLGAPLDVYVVRKLGVPGHEELAMGAIASGGVRVLSDDVIGPLGLTPSVINAVVRAELDELLRRERAYRGDRSPLDVSGKRVILIDDGLATGSTMRAAVAGLRQLEPSRIVVAVPVASREACQELSLWADDVVCMLVPVPFHAVGLWYARFDQTGDAEVRELLEASRRERRAVPGP
jgi:predicted phosphoribosyltransferase